MYAQWKQMPVNKVKVMVNPIIVVIRYRPEAEWSN